MKYSTRILLPLGVLIGIASGCRDSTEPMRTPPLTPPMRGLQIYVADQTGADARHLARGDAPVWSPDGSKIAFHQSRDASTSPGIFVIDPDGTDGRWITRGDAWLPRWSPDGTKLAFVRCILSGENDPFPMCAMTFSVINLDGSGETPLARTDFLGTVPPPAWSPDGKKVAFLGGEGHRSDLYVVDVDGSGITQLTQLGTLRTGVDWSPDGRTLAFGAAGSVHVVAADGSNLIRITADTDSLVVRSVVFSPEGDRIAYSLSVDPYVSETSSHPESSQVRVVNVDGTGGITVATNAADPLWLPDGHTLSYSRSGGEIWIASVAGGTPVLLLPDGSGARWSPDGTRLAYVTQP